MNESAVSLLLVLMNMHHEIVAVRTLEEFGNMTACLEARAEQQMVHATRGYLAVYICAAPRRT